MASNHECIQLMSWGANSHGQLGLGDKNDRSLPTKIEQNVVLEKPRQIIGGGAHTLLLTEQGILYGCGWNKDGQLNPVPNSDVIMTVFTQIPFLPKIRKVACGWNHTLALTDKGGVIGWGSNNYGQLAVDKVLSNSSKQTIAGDSQYYTTIFEESVMDIGAGMRHSGAVTENGTVYMWGDGKKGQLGIDSNDVNILHEPTEVVSLKGIHCNGISLGAQFTAIKTMQGDVYCYGDNRHGQCTLDASISGRVPLPYKVKQLSHVMKIECGWSHCIAITDDKSRRVFIWGRGDYGQLGNGNQGDQCEPRELPELQGVQQVSCGSEHTTVITRSGQVMSWGWNEHGNCGNGSHDNLTTPTLLKLPLEITPTLIGSGAGHTYLSLTNK